MKERKKMMNCLVSLVIMSFVATVHAGTIEIKPRDDGGLQIWGNNWDRANTITLQVHEPGNIRSIDNGKALTDIILVDGFPGNFHHDFTVD